MGTVQERRGRTVAAGRWWGVCLLCATVVACSRPADEQALRDALAAMQAAVEARESSAFMQFVAEDFAGPPGIDRDALRRMLAVQFLRNQSIGATLGPLQVRIDGERAQVDFNAVLTGGEGWIPQRADGYSIETGWRVEEGEWRLEWARWE